MEWFDLPCVLTTGWERGVVTELGQVSLPLVTDFQTCILF